MGTRAGAKTNRGWEMKEIKLRVFDKLSKLMFKNDEIIWNSGKVIKLYDQDWFSVNQKDIELMQYTGLKDCKGDDIYDGDIVLIKERNFMPNDKFKDAIATVEFSNGMFMIDNDYPTSVDLSKTVVIGNIYENSELLK